MFMLCFVFTSIRREYKHKKKWLIFLSLHLCLCRVRFHWTYAVLYLRLCLMPLVKTTLYQNHTQIQMGRNSSFSPDFIQVIKSNQRIVHSPSFNRFFEFTTTNSNRHVKFHVNTIMTLLWRYSILKILAVWLSVSGPCSKQEQVFFLLSLYTFLNQGYKSQVFESLNWKETIIKKI